MRILLVSRIAAASSVNRITASASASASAKTTASNGINNKTNGRIIVTTTKFLFAVVVVVATRYFSTATTAMTAINKNKNTIIKKVFCFGDSLTAGTSPPYERELFPYATYLEEALRTRSTSSTNIADTVADANNDNIDESNDNDNNACHLPEYTSVVVRWKGFPGWQASTLRDDGGLATIISNLVVKGRDDEPPPPPLDLILILAGTNDLAYEDDSSIIVSNIQGIHKIAHSYGCKTIALGIPPSGWQIQDSNKVGNIANEVNEKLQSWCCCDNDVGGSSSSTASSSSCSTIVTYVPFPIKEFDRDSGVWAPDGLHLSPEGYKTIGVSLSPIIANILNLC
jgi:lysophospholipase L1-like esterase